MAVSREITFFNTLSLLPSIRLIHVYLSLQQKSFIRISLWQSTQKLSLQILNFWKFSIVPQGKKRSLRLYSERLNLRQEWTKVGPRGSFVYARAHLGRLEDFQWLFGTLERSRKIRFLKCYSSCRYNVVRRNFLQRFHVTVHTKVTSAWNLKGEIKKKKKKKNAGT